MWHPAVRCRADHGVIWSPMLNNYMKTHTIPPDATTSQRDRALRKIQRTLTKVLAKMARAAEDEASKAASQATETGTDKPC